MINSFSGEYRFLSNFHMVKINHKGINFKSSEHAYQASKYLSRTKWLEVNEASTAGKAKRLGYKYKARYDWDNVRLSYMCNILKLKFDQHKDLKRKLMNTHPEELIEGNNWHDNFWGDCYCDDCTNKKGENNLGKLLMNLRNEYLNEI